MIEEKKLKMWWGNSPLLWHAEKTSCLFKYSKFQSAIIHKRRRAQNQNKKAQNQRAQNNAQNHNKLSKLKFWL
jgi:hypothetical protein